MTPPLSPESRQQLQTLAEAATKGPWSADLSVADVGAAFIYAGHQQVAHCGYLSVEGRGDDRNALFIAAAHPQTVLALLSALAAQEAENERLRQENGLLRFAVDFRSSAAQIAVNHALSASTPE